MLLARNSNVIVKDNDELITTLKKEEIDVVILTTPERVAQKVADELVQAGVKGILNFTLLVELIRLQMCKYIKLT